MKVNRVNHYVAEVTDYNYNDRAITDLFSEYKFICIRNENPVTQNQLVQLGEMFGKVYSHEWPLPLQSDAKMWVDGERKIFRISNALDKDKIELGGLGQQHAHWHCDASHMEDDFHGTILYNHYNGHLTKTIFSDQVAAYNSLTDEQKLEFEDTIGYHMINHGPDRPLVFGSFRYSGDKRETLPMERRMVMRQPFTKEKCLYLSPVTWAGSRTRDSNQSLTKEYIFTLANETATNKYTHEWQQYDVCINDNIGLMHERLEWKHGIRVLYRLHFSYDKCSI